MFRTVLFAAKFVLLGAACSPYPLCDPNSAEMQRVAPSSYVARFNTTAGVFSVGVNSSWAPHASSRFFNLARLGFYDGVYFFRVIDGFVNEFGLSGNPKLQASYCNDEACPPGAEGLPPDGPIVAGGPSNVRGAIGFSLMDARGNGASVELFVNLANNSRLDSQGFVPFGLVTAVDMAVVDELYGGYGEMNQTDLCPDPTAKLCDGPKIQRIVSEGNAYLSRQFPRMSFVHAASIVQL